jgi:hypothetical protein
MGGGALIVKLERNAEHVVTLPLKESCHDRGINAARHRDDNASLGRLLGKSE